MLTIFQFLRDNPDIIFFGISVLCFIITFIRTGSVKKSLSDFKEVNNMKYQTQSRRVRKATEFSEYVPQYVLNPVSNELEELSSPKNLQAQIQSYENCALQAQLDKFLVPDGGKEDVYDVYSQFTEDLSDLGSYMELAEEYREKLGLPDTASVQDIYAKVDELAQYSKKQLSQSKEDYYKQLAEENKKLKEALNNGKGEEKKA